jgi:hypothetical protein
MSALVDVSPSALSAKLAANLAGNLRFGRPANGPTGEALPKVSCHG